MTTTHPLVLQLKFTRSEFKRGLKGLSEEDASKRLLPMNCISWNVGHLAWQEQKYILYYGQGQMPYPEIDKVFAYGAPASMPSMRETLILWQKITQSTNAWLETHLWLVASTHDLPLLVPQRRKPGDPADAGAH